MKRILIIIAMLWSVAQAQTTGYFRYDTSKFYTTKVSGRGSIDVTGNVKFTGLLPKSAGTDSVVVRDASGNLGTTAKSAFGGSQTWQQTLTTGSTLTGNNTIAGGGFDFTWNNANGWLINGADDMVITTTNGGLNNTQFGATTGAAFMSNSLLSNSHGSEIDVYPDSITLNPGGGVLRIDTLNYLSAASDSMVVWNKLSHNIGMRAIPSGSGTPTLTANQIAYGDGSNLMTSSSALKFTAATPSFQAFTPGGTVELGDISGTGNNTRLIIDDGNSTMQLYAPTNITISSNGSGSQININSASNGVITLNDSVYVDGDGTFNAGQGVFKVTPAGVVNIDNLTASKPVFTDASKNLVSTGVVPVANGGTGITSLGTGVATALGVNVGSAGAFVVNGGALGTPSSGTLTNATGLPEAGLSLTDITTNNVSTSAHGFFPKLTSNRLYYVNNSGALTALAFGTTGKVLTTNGATSDPTWETPSGGAPTWNSITDPTGDLALTFGAGESTTFTDQNTTEDLFTVTSSTGTTNSLFSLNRTGTALASGNNIMELISSGANGTNAITAKGLNISVTNTNATSGTNVGLDVTASGATTGNYAILATGKVGIDQATPTSKLQVNTDANSVTQADANGILLANATAAINNTQSISPPLIIQGNGWATGVNNSQDVRFRMDVLPVQAATNPTATWQLSRSINGAAYGGTLSYTSGGVFGNSSGSSQFSSTAASTIIGGVVSVTGGASYKTTNGGSFVTTGWGQFRSGGTTSGTISHYIDPSANGYVFIAYNASGAAIARAGIQITNLTNTAGSEAGDLAFYTQSGGAAMSEKMRISSTGVTNLFKGADVASAGTITPTGNIFHVTGTTTVTSVSGTGITAGTTITIIFDGILTFTDGSNLKLAGDFVTSADDTWTGTYDGTNWYEKSRSVN